jgi:hypothetical protein
MMFKKLTAILVLLLFILSTVPVYGADFNFSCDRHDYSEKYGQAVAKAPVIYKSDLWVTRAGGTYQVGFATIQFPKNYIDSDKLPVRIRVEISSVKGVAGIEFTPDIPSFNKDVIISVNSYNGLLYDYTLKKNIRQDIHRQTLKVHHFSRYAFS